MHLEFFQLIDRVEHFDRPANRIRCVATVPEESSIFQGHFPGHPLMPGTLLVESMAQASGYLLLSILKFERLPFLIQIDKAKIRTFIEPGTELTVTGELEHAGSGFAVTNGAITRGRKAVAEAQLRFRTMPFPSKELQQMIREYAGTAGLDTEAGA